MLRSSLQILAYSAALTALASSALAGQPVKRNTAVASKRGSAIGASAVPRPQRGTYQARPTRASFAQGLNSGLRPQSTYQTLLTKQPAILTPAEKKEVLQAFILILSHTPDDGLLDALKRIFAEDGFYTRRDGQYGDEFRSWTDVDEQGRRRILIPPILIPNLARSKTNVELNRNAWTGFFPPNPRLKRRHIAVSPDDPAIKVDYLFQQIIFASWLRLEGFYLSIRTDEAEAGKLPHSAGAMKRALQVQLDFLQNCKMDIMNYSLANLGWGIRGAGPRKRLRDTILGLNGQAGIDRVVRGIDAAQTFYRENGGPKVAGIPSRVLTSDEEQQVKDAIDLIAQYSTSDRSSELNDGLIVTKLNELFKAKKIRFRTDKIQDANTHSGLLPGYGENHWGGEVIDKERIFLSEALFINEVFFLRIAARNSTTRGVITYRMDPKLILLLEKLVLPAILRHEGFHALQSNYHAIYHVDEDEDMGWNLQIEFLKRCKDDILGEQLAIRSIHPRERLRDKILKIFGEKGLDQAYNYLSNRIEEMETNKEQLLKNQSAIAFDLKFVPSK